MNPKHLFRRRDLPHWDVPGGTYFVTSCLEGSIPAAGLVDLMQYRAELAARERPPDVADDDWDLRRWKYEFARMEHYLDTSPGARLLERTELAELVTAALLFFADQRYEVFSFVVMPSHFHWVFRPLPSWVATLPDTLPHRSPRERVMYSIRRFTSRRCNQVLRRHGVFWQPESYDHWVRDLDELERIIQYVENNPVKARLVSKAEDWRYSSARIRCDLGLSFGSPLPRV